MPLVNQKKAIRFNSLQEMEKTIAMDGPYQYRHLVIRCILRSVGPQTRKSVSDYTGIPVNAVPRTVSTLVDEGILMETDKIECPSTGRMSRGVAMAKYNGKL